MRVPQSAASDDTWPDFICATCHGPAGDTTNTGIVVRGGYGSTRYDTSSLIWVVRGADVYPTGYMCDGCIDRAVSDGALEEFQTSLGAAETGLYLSEAAYHELFCHGARSAYDAFWSAREDSPYVEARDPEALRTVIEGMRYRLSGDEVLASAVSTQRSPLGWGAVNIGYAHAVAAIALGCGEADPGFETAAADWAQARRALDAQIDLASHSTEAMFAAMAEDTDSVADQDGD